MVLCNQMCVCMSEFLARREFILEYQSFIQVSHYWLKLHTPIMIGLDPQINQGDYKGSGLRNHFAVLDKITL